MMEQDDFVKDDFLHRLIQQHPLESPSDDFIERVMANITPAAEPVRAVKPFYFYLKASIPYVISAIVAVFVISTSDLPLFNWLPGKEYLQNNLMPYFDASLALLKNAFSSKYVAWTLLVSASAGILYLVDRMLSRRFTI